MGMNITHTMNSFQFENREHLRNTARDILNRKASEKVTENIAQKALNANSVYHNPQLAIIKASSQISINNSLKETLKYLRSHANQKENKKHILGELWETIKSETELDYNGELLDFEINIFAKNIFAA